ncbi:MAG TPA: CS1 fimbrial subunit B flags: Precursor [Dyella sp.]|uniref:CS1 fimbrial subunit B flags: Precursor n=1 Tax=Dyella sp. TaxID=1869338 RepID=UPI002F958672
MYIRITLTLALLVSCIPAFAASPNIHVGAVYDYLEPGKHILVKRISNGGDATAYVRVDVSEIVYDKQGQPREIPVDKTAFSGKNAGDADANHAHALAASPSRLIVPANGQLTTRLVAEGSRDIEHYYRIRFVPVVKPEDFALSEDEVKAYSESVKAGVSVITGYGTIVIARPNKIRYETQLDDKSETYTVRNQGNSIVLLDDFQDCRGSNDCTEHRKIHILPGHSQQFAKESGHTYRFFLVEGTARRPVRF